MANTDLIRVGTINGVHGIRGWVKVYSFTEDRAAVLSYSPWQLTIGGENRSVKVLAKQDGGKVLLARLEGVDSRDAAEAMVGAEIYVESSQLPVLDDGQYYWRDLIGCTVISTQSEAFGTLEQMLATGANDVMVVQGDHGEILIPWVLEKVVVDVDLAQRMIKVDWELDE
ncbi:MAG: ribosome maturation factor RimM [Gammaproteobacteria bacterium]|nr:ribosome maturation factor RimM [Gammaproteobacteria bacterium]